MTKRQQRASAMLLAVFLVGATLEAAPAARRAEAPSASPVDVSELRALYLARDYFSLRDRLEGQSAQARDMAEVGFYLAALDHAFNRPAESNRAIEGAIGVGLPPQLVSELAHLRLSNLLRLHRYADAWEAARQILEAPAGRHPRTLVEEAGNLAVLARSLADVPPQEAEIRGPSRLALGKTRRIPLEIEGGRRSFTLDTGANFSVIMRSEAEKLGLAIRPAGVQVDASTGKQVFADVTVAASVRIGNVHYRNVVFLVFPDRLLSFADGTRIPGLVGFPVIEALGEARFRRDNVLEIPIDPPRRGLGNLALERLDPLVRIRYAGENLVCRLDTGAERTVFYEPFYHRFRERVEGFSDRVTATPGGVGGREKIAALRLRKTVFTLASVDVNLRNVDVYTRPLDRSGRDFLFCNVGLDALQRYRMYILNFRDMALLLR